MNVLIVGAGPTGLTTAVELARRGIEPVIIDKREQASTFSRAVGITPRSLQLLRVSGVADRLIAEGIAMDGLRVYQGNKLSLELPLHSDRTYFPTILGLPQDRTESIMSECLTSLGVSVQYGQRLKDFFEDNTGVIAKFSSGEEQVFDTIVGADGVGSATRKIADINYSGFDLEQTWSIADVDAKDWRHPSKITLVQAARGKLIVVAPLSESRYRVVASDPNALDALPLPLNVSNIRREGTFNISVRQAQTYSKGRIHLAGDAAHCHSPVGGRGMNLGIADGAELAKRIIENSTQGYTNVRHHEGAEAIKMTERGRLMTGGKSWSSRIAFRSLLAMTNRSGPLKKRLGRFLVEF